MIGCGLSVKSTGIWPATNLSLVKRTCEWTTTVWLGQFSVKYREIGGSSTILGLARVVLSFHEMSTFITCIASTAALLLVSEFAAASTCVTIDESRDNLSQADREGARTLFEEALRENSFVVARDNCAETWVLYHIKLGSSVTVIVHSPRGDRKEQVTGLSGLPGMYSQIVRSIQMGIVGSSESPVVDRKNVTDAQTTPNRLPADSIWYLTLGYGATAASSFYGGPSFGFGKRWELDRVGIDLSFLNATIYQGKNGSQGASGAWVKIGLDYFFDAYSNYSPYVGAGLSLASNEIDTSGNHLSGWGVNAELMAGYELFRASTIRLLVQANASLPTYTLSGEPTYSYNAGTTTIISAAPNRYAPVFGLTLGIGWGKPREVAVVKVEE